MTAILQRLFASIRPDPDGVRALQMANARLQKEVDAHQATLAALAAAHASLELQVAERVEDIRVLNERFAAGLSNSPVTLIEQDEALRYTWVFNPPADIDAEAIVGRGARDYVAEDQAAAVAALRQEVLATGEAREAEVRIERNGRAYWYLYRSQPTRLRDGRAGVITSSVDITAQKRQQEHLQLVTRELNHRSKNLLTMVMSLARQTAVGLEAPQPFLARLAERLASLASAHDVLVRQDWSGADLRAVIEGQLKHQLQAFSDRLHIEGPACELPAEAAHYVGLAIHELGSNAAKYGALSNGEGRVDLTWTTAEQRLRLDWRESGGPPVAGGGAKGFGRSILETLTPQAVKGRASLDFAPGGVVWVLDAPL